MARQKFQLARRLLSWYDRNRRDLPWRAVPGDTPNPYHVLVSEAMLQQTQVATVIPYFQRFIHRWPTVAALARADEQAVLRAWQGLGYYSRARHILAAARQIVSLHAGCIPVDLASLQALPGVGRYTAGAIASIAFDVCAPILDGNVARVLCRLDRISSDPTESKTRHYLWRRAEEILPKSRCGDFNSALMDLGATVCTPRSPNCPACPLKSACKSFATASQHLIPAPRHPRPTTLSLRQTFCIRNGTKNPAWLIEQRPHTGRWAGLWQFVTVKSDDSPVTSSTITRAAAITSTYPRPIATIHHTLTHRRYQFTVYFCQTRRLVAQKPPSTRRWVRLDQLSHYPLPKPHLRIAEILKSLGQER